jgi:predicted phosphodiesterase
MAAIGYDGPCLRIGLISDTHSAGSGRDLPGKVLEVLSGVDLILHCGDLECLGVLDYLETVAPVLAVRGYEDPREPGDRLADAVRVVHADGVAIGMIHDIQWPGPRIVPNLDNTLEPGLDFPSDYSGGLAAGSPQDLLAKKFGRRVDAVVFGDTHEEMVATYDGVLLVNPGSPTYPGRRHRAGVLGTIGLMEVNEGVVTARLVNLETLGR